ncbi:MAG: ATP-binding protein [Methylotenera sp.]|nr:ATP-binding protein [Methylotenera sp.]MDD4924974.1 ATP-binding protein [Methylotenera sp.]
MSFIKSPLEISFNPLIAMQNDLSLQARAIRIINIFRFILSLVFISFYFYVEKSNWLDSENAPLFFSVSLAYGLFSFTLIAITPFKSKALTYFHPLQIVIDIIFVILMMYAAGGIQSGLGLLLIITIVTASLVSNGRLSLFYAAVATIGLLLEQSYQITKWGLSASSYSQPVMLSLGCFATAWLAYSLAKRMQQSEALASARGVDLENLEQVNALITQEMQDGVIVVDQNANIRHHNTQANTLLSLTKNSHQPLQLDESTPEIARAFSDWVNSENAMTNSIISINNRELKLRFEPINHDNRQLGAVIFIQDWSQIQSVAQQAKLAALGRLTANIAHEIRNPLSAISHANQLLQEEENITAPNMRMLQIIADNIGRIDQIIKDVLELNRRDRTHQENIALNPFLTDFYHQFCAVEKVPASNFKLTLFTQEQTITFDQRHLTQILWNVCKNGWEHSRKQEHSLNLHCVEVGNAGLNLEISDDGDGVAEQNRSKLFEPFYTTKATGNGLGLYISRELAEANGAFLRHHALDHGSAFILQLTSDHS